MSLKLTAIVREDEAKAGAAGRKAGEGEARTDEAAPAPDADPDDVDRSAP
jgi:hypothetical protein